MSGIVRANNAGQSGAVSNIETIDSDDYVDASIDNAHLADDAVDSDELAAGSVDSAHLAADVITGAKIADDAVDSEHYTDGSIDNAHIADDAIDSEHYADGSIDNAHIADDAIDSEHYAAGSIDTAHIADNQVTAAKIFDLARGSVLVGNASAATAELTIGTDNYVLTSDGSDIAWEAAAAGAVTRVGGNTTEASSTATSAEDVFTVSSLSIGTTTGFDMVCATRKTSGATAGFGCGTKLVDASGNVITAEADATGGHVFLPTNHNTNAAEDRWGHLESGIRITNYVRGIISVGNGFTASAQTAGGRPQINYAMRVQTVTSIVIRGFVSNASITGGIDEGHVYTRAIS